MSNTIHIPQPLQKLTGGQAEVSAEGETVRDVIASLEGQFAGIRERLLDDDGKLRRFVNLYLNDEDIRFLSNLDTAIKAGDKLSIVPAIAGGTEPGAPGNAKKKFYLTLPQQQIQRPLLYDLIKKFDVIPNIRSASVSHEIGLMAVELEGSAESIDAATAWLTSIDVIVEPLEKNVIE